MIRLLRYLWDRALTALVAGALLFGLVVILASTTPTSSEPVAIRGQVVGDSGPLENARVRMKGSDSLLLTDEQGRFQIEFESEIDQSPFGKRVTASAQGYFIGGVEWRRADLRIRLKPLPTEDHQGYQWIDPTPDEKRQGACGNCHGELYEQWKSGGHAAAATNRRFLNLYDGSKWDGGRGGWSLLHEHPDGAGVCGSCHAPSIDFDHPSLDDIRLAEGVDAQGVHCDFCHKIRDIDVADVGLNHGRYAVDLLRPDGAAHGQIFFGPWDDVDRGEDAYSPLMSESHYCASCHEGTVFGAPVYTTYSEWLQSKSAREGVTCQQCHMTPNGSTRNVAPGRGGLDRDPKTVASHGMMPGGKLSMLKRCLLVQVERRMANVDVTISTRNIGHFAPTGFIDRHLILVVESFDRSGNRAALVDGERLGEVVGEDLAGRPGRLFARLLHDPQGRAPVPFWRSVSDPRDTRLPPDSKQTFQFRFVRQVDRVRVRVLYRRFWRPTAIEKGWPDDTLTVFDKSFP